MKRRLIPLLIAATVLAIYSTAPAQADTPTPSPEDSQTVQVVPGEGLRHIVEVQDTDGRPLPDGWIVSFSNADIRPPANDKEVEEAKARGPCALLEVKDGAVDLTPRFDGPCPEGSRIAVDLFESLDAEGGIGADLSSPIEWRTASADDEVQLISARPMSPLTGDINTDSGAPTEAESPLAAPASKDSSDFIYVAFGIAALLAVASLAFTVRMKGAKR